MENPKNRSFIDVIWDIFASVKFAVVIFALISLSSVVGTVLEQGAEPEKNIEILSRLFGVSAAPGLYSMLHSLGFMNMYHSWWFILFLLLFAANLIICSIDRLPRILKLVGDPLKPVSADFLRNMSIMKTITVPGKPDSLKDRARDALSGIGFKGSESTEYGGIQLFAEKGNYTRLGVYITHLSVLIILAGAIIGSFLGFKAFLNLPEGQTSAVAYRQGGVEVPLGFEIRCDNFEVDFYEQTDTPKDYKSWLTVIKDGKEVLKKAIEVNDPLSFDGITFYQSSYGTLSNDINGGIFVLRLVSGDGQSSQINPRIGDSFTIPGTQVQGRIVRFSPALSLNASGQPFTYAEQLINPAVYIEFTEAGEQKFSGWLLRRYPQTWSLPDGNRVEFLNYWGVEYTGLQVRRDPGVLIVYLGCIIMSIGLYMTFFMSHRKVWIHVTEEKGGSQILVGASANKNRASFEKKIEKLVHLLSAEPKGGK